MPRITPGSRVFLDLPRSKETLHAEYPRMDNIGKQRSGLLVTGVLVISMITDKIGRQEVLLTITKLIEKQRPNQLLKSEHNERSRSPITDGNWRHEAPIPIK